MLARIREPQSHIVLQHVDDGRLVLHRSQLLQQDVASGGDLLGSAIRLDSRHDSRVVLLEGFPLLIARSNGAAAGRRQREDVVERQLGEIQLLLSDLLVVIYLLLGRLVGHIFQHGQQAGDDGGVAGVEQLHHTVQRNHRNVELDSRPLDFHLLAQLIGDLLGTEEEAHLLGEISDRGSDLLDSVGVGLLIHGKAPEVVQLTSCVGLILAPCGVCRSVRLHHIWKGARVSTPFRRQKLQQVRIQKLTDLRERPKVLGFQLF